jgi:long-chain acyl-CoA synthetase
LLPVLQAVKEQSSVVHILQTSLLDVLPAKPEIAFPANLTAERRSVPGAVDLIQALADISRPPPDVTIDLDEAAALNYTGGTTGMPKGCVHTRRDMLFTGAVMSSISTSANIDDVVLNFWPIFWIAGEDVGILLPVVTGATCILLARWDPVACSRAVERYRVTTAMMVVDKAVEIMEHARRVRMTCHRFEMS